MIIKLYSLALENFKGLRQFTFKPKGKNINIYGSNKKGKTTLNDAFCWLWTDRDSKGNADFKLKTTKPDGTVINHLDHSVSAVVEIDGNDLMLKKTLKEKWSKKRGSANSTLSSHTTDYYIDDMGSPISQTEWKRRISDMIDPNIFRIVTDPGFFLSNKFNLQIPGKKITKPADQWRRGLLMEAYGETTDEQVINSDRALASLPGILEGRSLDDHRRAVKLQKKKVEERRDEIPPGIKELKGQLPKEAKNRKAIEVYIAHIDGKLRKAKDDTEMQGLRKQLADGHVKLSEAKAEQAKVLQEARQKIDEKIFQLKPEIRGIKSRIKEDQETIDSTERTIRVNEMSMIALRETFGTVTARESTYKEICPACNQPIPEDKIEAAKLLFNQMQAQELASINKDGKKLKAKNEELRSLITNQEKKIKADQNTLDARETVLLGLEKERELVKPEIPDFIVTMMKDVANLEADIKDHPKTDTASLEAERREELAKLASLDAAIKIKERIGELEMEEKTLGGVIENLENQLFLMEKFTVIKSKLTEKNINKHFEIIKWKLFEIQINGGVNEICIPMIDGSTELSNSEERQAGLDSIKSFSKYYGINAPVWIDNAESITETLDVGTQTIKLIVDPNCEEMEIHNG